MLTVEAVNGVSTVC